MNQKKKTSKKSCLWLILFFAVLIGGLAAVDLFTPSRNFSDFENRYLKQKPALSWQGLMDGSYTQSYENFINDQFVLRNQWIDLKSRAEGMLFKVENNGIVYGKKDMMFEKHPSVNESQLEKNLGFVEKFAKGRENLTLMVVPSAYEIYRENLPYGLQMADQKSGIEEIYSRLGSQMETIDLFPALMEHKEEYLYYRTDHHWTTNGAYLAYLQYCREKGFEPVDLENLSKRQVEGFYGSYFNKCKKTSAKADTLAYFELPIKSVVIDGEEKEGYLDFDQLDKRDKYAAFLYGNHGLTVLRGENSPNGQSGESRVLLLKDSFANCFAPLLTLHYDEVYIVDLRSFPTGLQKLVDETSFDDILILYNFMNLESDTNFYRMEY